MTRPTRAFPTKASANSAIGSTQIGRFSDCRNALTSRNGATETRNAAAKIATSVVDHGSETAIRIAKISAEVDHAAGSRHRRRIDAGSDCLATALTPGLRVRARPAMSC